MRKITLILGFNLTLTVSFAQNLDVIGNINTKGKISLNGNTGTTGQVLTSNGAAAPTWNTLVAPLTTIGGRFRYKYENVTAQTVSSQTDNNFTTSVTTNTSQSAFMSFLVQDYNTNSDVSIDLASGLITFNRTGLYYLETMVRLFVTSTSTAQGEGLAGNINFTINGSTSALIADQKLFEPAGLIGNNLSYVCNIPIKTTQYFTAGQTLRVKMNIFNLKQNTNLIAIGLSQGGYLAGHFISE